MNLRHCASLLSLALACAIPVAAHADTVESFSATLVNGGTVSGTLTFGAVTVPNNQPGQPPTISGYEVTGDDFTVVSNGDTYTFLNSYAVGGTNNQPYAEFFFGSASSYLILDFPGNTPLAALPIGAICSTNAPCSGINYLGAPDGSQNSSFVGGADSSAVGSGSLSATPEPSSLMLLGTGLIGVAGAARRRFFKK